VEKSSGEKILRPIAHNEGVRKSSRKGVTRGRTKDKKDTGFHWKLTLLMWERGTNTSERISLAYCEAKPESSMKKKRGRARSKPRRGSPSRERKREVKKKKGRGGSSSIRLAGEEKKGTDERGDMMLMSDLQEEGKEARELLRGRMLIY